MENSWYRLNPVEVTVLGGALTGSVTGIVYYGYLFLQTLDAASSVPIISGLLCVCSLLCAVGSFGGLRLAYRSPTVFLTGMTGVFLLYVLTPYPAWIPGRLVFWVHTGAYPLTLFVFALPKVRQLVSRPAGDPGHQESPSTSLESPVPAGFGIPLVCLVLALGCSMVLLGPAEIPGNRADEIRSFVRTQRQIYLLKDRMTSFLKDRDVRTSDEGIRQAFQFLSGAGEERLATTGLLWTNEESPEPLDPWGQTYVTKLTSEQTDSDTRRVTVYSKGPNGRDEGRSGDDVTVNALDAFLLRRSSAP